jgi:hypothetical protein
MGITIHRIVVVTSTFPEHILKARNTALEIFNNWIEYERFWPLQELVGPLMPSLANGYQTFVIAPTGSNEGYGIQEEVTERVDKFVNWLDAYRVSDGGSHLDWFVAYYGETEDGMIEIGPEKGDVKVSG